MPTYSIQTTKETLDSLVEILESRPKTKSNEDLIVSVTISDENGHEETYYGIDVLMSTLALGKFEYTKNAIRHLISMAYEQQIKEHANVTKVAASAYRSSLDKYWVNIELMDSRSLGGMVHDFKYVEQKTGIEPDHGLLNEVFSKTLDADSPERFITFLSGVYIRYLNSKDNIDLSPSHIYKVYSLMVHPSRTRTRQKIQKWNESTGILPMIDGISILPDAYANIMVTGIKPSSRGI